MIKISIKKMLRSSIQLNSKKTQNKTLINCAQLELYIIYYIYINTNKQVNNTLLIKVIQY